MFESVTLALEGNDPSILNTHLEPLSMMALLLSLLWNHYRIECDLLATYDHNEERVSPPSPQLLYVCGIAWWFCIYSKSQNIYFGV